MKKHRSIKLVKYLVMPDDTKHMERRLHGSHGNGPGTSAMHDETGIAECS